MSSNKDICEKCESDYVHDYIMVDFSYEDGEYFEGWCFGCIQRYAQGEKPKGLQ